MRWCHDYTHSTITRNRLTVRDGLCMRSDTCTSHPLLTHACASAYLHLFIPLSLPISLPVFLFCIYFCLCLMTLQLAVCEYVSPSYNSVFSFILFPSVSHLLSPAFYLVRFIVPSKKAHFTNITNPITPQSVPVVN